MRGRLGVVALGLATVLVAGMLSAEDTPGSGSAPGSLPEGRALGLGVVLGAGWMNVGSDSSSAVAAGIVGRLGLDSRNRFQLIGEFYPTSIESPIIDEAFTSANFLLGFSFGGSFKIRPVVGAQYRRWSGSERVTASDWGPVFGLDLGPELRVSDTVTVSPEFILRLSVIEVEGSVGSSLVGVQCVISWRRGS